MTHDRTDPSGSDDVSSSHERWHVPQSFDAVFDWSMSSGTRELLALYQKGKERQWNASSRIDWSQELDPENPQQLPAEALPIFGAPFLSRISDSERAEVFRHYQAWSVSQFLHGEQGALVCAAKTVQQVPNTDAKLYAATQVVDEARHVEAYGTLLEKFGVSYPVTGPMRELLDQVLRDSRWDMTYLGMQIVIEGLALAAFAAIRDTAQNPLAAAVNAYVMEDEARHVAFGRIALRDHYPQLTAAERSEREEFLIEACHLMRSRFDAVELWRTLDLPENECLEYVEKSESRQAFRAMLYSRIVPAAKDIGLWGERIRAAFGRMGILGYAQIPLDRVQDRDEAIAQELDARRRRVEQAIAAGRAEPPEERER
jgi:hypothetical protein